MPPAAPFRLFGPDHLAAMALTALAAVVIARWGRALPPAYRTAVRGLLTGLLLAYAVAAYWIALQRLGPRWDALLPLNLCDWVLVAVLVALLFRNPLAAELAYYWGFAGTLQGLLTPDLRTGFPSFAYVHFFWGHGGILIAIVWMLVAEGCRPRPGAVLRLFLASNLYILVVGLIDWRTGWNYGYLYRKPYQPSLLDYLGPWPWYLLSLEAIGLSLFLLLDLPWQLSRRRSATRLAEDQIAHPALAEPEAPG
jgi:hypothetical integral membrane protein (TIGR02206 family)